MHSVSLAQQAGTNTKDQYVILVFTGMEWIQKRNVIDF